MRNDVISLIRIIGVPGAQVKTTLVESQEYYDLAYSNKISLFYLESLKKNNKLNLLKYKYELNKTRHNQLYCDINRLSSCLDNCGLNYVYIKTFRYFPENPNDIDILVFGKYQKKISDLEKKLLDIGYIRYTIGNNKYNFGKIGKIGFWDYKRPKNNFRSGNPYKYFDLDFYFEIMVEEFIHGNKNNFSKYTTIREFENIYNGTKIQAKILQPGAELFYLFFHSIFPTGIIGLELFYSSVFILKNFTKEDFEIFWKLSRLAHLHKETSFCIHLLNNLYEEAFSHDYRGFIELINSDKKPINIKLGGNESFPYIFSIFFFIKAGVKSTLHKKGVISIFFVLIKCINPFYTYNIVKEILSRKCTINRYASKFHKN